MLHHISIDPHQLPRRQDGMGRVYKTRPLAYHTAVRKMARDTALAAGAATAGPEESGGWTSGSKLYVKMGWRREMQCSARWWWWRPRTGRWRGGEAGVAGEIDRGHLTGTQPGDSENERQLPTANRSLRQAQALDMPLNACRAKAAASWEQDACSLLMAGLVLLFSC
jgi:hypothetical protein